jgi:hypothetical protein
MHQSKRLRALAVIPFMALGLSAQTGVPAATGQTVRVSEHPSRWDYPKEVTPGAGQDIHVVQKGDTLWDLGAKYLGNPFAWPQIWELNKWVKDPHWIYPGDPILVESSRGTVTQGKDGESLAPREVADLQPDTGRMVRKRTQDEFAFTFQDFVQMPFLVPGTAEAYFKQIGAFKVVGREDATKDLLADGDSLYIGGGSNQGVKVGDRMVVTNIVARKFYHPDDRHRVKVMGDIVEQFGIIRVTTVYADQSVALIEKSLDGISPDGYAAPYKEPVAIVNALRADAASPVRMKEPVSKVIFIRMNKAVASAGDLVIIDCGTSDGFKVGDVLITARPVALDQNQTGPSKIMTNTYLGQLMVIKAGERAATCRILRSVREVMVGDILTH